MRPDKNTSRSLICISQNAQVEIDNAKFFYRLMKSLETFCNVLLSIFSVMKQNIAEYLKAFLKKIEQFSITPHKSIFSYLLKLYANESHTCKVGIIQGPVLYFYFQEIEVKWC